MVLSGREPDKNVPLLGYLLYMTHDHALLLLWLIMYFHCGLENKQPISILLEVTTFGDDAEGDFLLCLLQLQLCPQGAGWEGPFQYMPASSYHKQLAHSAPAT